MEGCECSVLLNFLSEIEGMREVLRDPMMEVLLRGVSLLRELLRYSRLASRFPWLLERLTEGSRGERWTFSH